ncbi:MULTISPECIES: hypothetical protein [Streptomyces]|uniref:hypothetical protein n=1 Tax=Streptomyces TaxID=1883 RepID=UPI00117DFF93|nr:MULTISPECIES: hypothetical protein [unclassified Streptomyces]MYU27403.1 hypothetical protein [Streptomyces sp. SID7810]BCM72401.1 hypothetical protein EASAB2608_07735 [Streptomyces sp. EAS-AB2608]
MSTTLAGGAVAGPRSGRTVLEHQVAGGVQRRGHRARQVGVRARQVGVRARRDGVRAGPAAPRRVGRTRPEETGEGADERRNALEMS